MNTKHNISYLNKLFNLEDKVAAVIGGGGHLCSAMAKGLAAAGCSVIVLDIRLEKADDIISQINKEFKGNHLPLKLDASIKLKGRAKEAQDKSSN